MLIFPVNSIPLKDVIISLANSFGVAYHHDGEEYFLYLPEHIGEGEIRGISFECGLALIIYKVIFKENIRLEFTVDEIHPVKFIYSVEGHLTHEFADEGIPYQIAEYQSVIVASKRKSGHIIEFSKDTRYEIISVEIDRKTFGEKARFELMDWDSKLQDVLRDVEGEKQFSHIENSGIFFRDIIQNSENFKDFLLARMFNLQSITMQIFVTQIVQFNDDCLHTNQRTILRISELKKIEELGQFIKNNIGDVHTIKNISFKTGLNPTKLQTGFKYIFSTSVNEFVINARLEHAYILLQNNEYNIGEIVIAVGLESNSYFTRIFKRKYGMTPTDFRKVSL